LLNENVKLWVEALRSGEYEQGKDCLSNGDEFCCLGVACDLYSKYNKPILFILENGVKSYDGDTVFLPFVVQDWLGLKSHSGVFSNANSLAQMNDGGLTFKEIADMIESEPEGLFV